MCNAPSSHSYDGPSARDQHIGTQDTSDAPPPRIEVDFKLDIDQVVANLKRQFELQIAEQLQKQLQQLLQSKTPAPSIASQLHTLLASSKVQVMHNRLRLAHQRDLNLPEYRYAEDVAYLLEQIAAIANTKP